MSDLRCQPYFLASYICGMGHLVKTERESLEKMATICADEISQKRTGMFSRLQQGQRVVDKYNTDHIEDGMIIFVETTRTYNQESDNDTLDNHNDTIDSPKQQH